VGYFLWREAKNNRGTVTAAESEPALEAAHRLNAHTVIEAAFSTASRKDLEYLHAMAQDEGPSTVGIIGDERANYSSRSMTASALGPR